MRQLIGIFLIALFTSCTENTEHTPIVDAADYEKFLTSTIESVLNQSYKNLEIIAVDDGSTDNSQSILQKYENKIKIFQQKNQGLAIAVNFAIKQMKGKWLKWLSPDDLLEHNAIEILVDEANKQSKNTILYSNWDIIDEKNNKLRSFSESNYNELDIFDFNVRLLAGQQINVNTTLIPASLFEENCLFEKLEDPVAIDYHFFLKAGIIFNAKYHLIEKPLLQYRIHSEQLSHKKISQTLSFLAKVQSQILSLVDDSTKEKYQNALLEYEKKKPLQRKTMELGLKIAKDAFPDWVTDWLLVFYLNKIRSSR